MIFTYARYAPNGVVGYECSSKGDTRFSALYAYLDDGRSIETAYQLDCKGYRVLGNHWTLGKGKPPLNGLSYDALWRAYKGLWELWAEQNPELIEELRLKAVGGLLTDCFASTPVSQARALAEILNSTNPTT